MIVDNRPGAGGNARRRDRGEAPPGRLHLHRDRGQLCGESGLYKLRLRSRQRHHRRHSSLAGAAADRGAPVAARENVKDLIAVSKAKKGGLAYASSGQGSIVHLATELFLHTTGIQAVHIPYKGTGPAITDTIAGQTQMLWGSIAAVMPQVKSGRLRAVAVTTAKRIPALPDVLTVMDIRREGTTSTVARPHRPQACPSFADRGMASHRR